MNIKSKFSINGKSITSLGSPQQDFINHLFAELNGTPSLDTITGIIFMSGQNQMDAIPDNGAWNPTSTSVRVSGYYTPSTSYTLDGVMITTANGYKYFYTTLQNPVNVTGGQQVEFEWDLTFGVNRISTGGFLSNMTLNMNGLFTAIASILAQGRNNAYPNGISLKPSKAVVIASDGSTVIAESDKITVTPDNTTYQITYETGDMVVTKTTTDKEYISKIDLVDTISNINLIEWNYVQYEFVNVNDIVRVKFILQV